MQLCLFWKLKLRVLGGFRCRLGSDEMQLHARLYLSHASNEVSLSTVACAAAECRPGLGLSVVVAGQDIEQILRTSWPVLMLLTILMKQSQLALNGARERVARPQELFGVGCQPETPGDCLPCSVSTHPRAQLLYLSVERRKGGPACPVCCWLVAETWRCLSNWAPGCLPDAYYLALSVWVFSMQ